jgi:hypothetical protein
MVDIKQLEQKLLIEDHALDIALREHPDLFYQVANALALAISERDEAKLALDEIEAEAAMAIRDEAAKYEEKITDKTVEMRVKTDAGVMKAARQFIQFKNEATRWTVLKEAYESRSYALSKLVDLYIANYYSSNEDKKTHAPAMREVRASQVKEINKSRRVSP